MTVTNASSDSRRGNAKTDNLRGSFECQVSSDSQEDAADAETRSQSIASFECEECGRTFKLRRSLMSHKRIHTEAKPFTCDVCPKSFFHSSALKVHRKRKHLPPTLECEFCHMTFGVMWDLKRHQDGDNQRSASCKMLKDKEVKI